MVMVKPYFTSCPLPNRLLFNSPDPPRPAHFSNPVFPINFRPFISLSYSSNASSSESLPRSSHKDVLPHM
ncbi:hypothetical protein BD779DRAFT_236494 [Infundibulicybe gibba]|nr:hypothetical protein BD779DRAFT_236494 [Infundibulicybe gibba]